MKNASIHQPELKRDWELSYGPFHQLLKWFDEGKDSGGEKYLEMRRRLVLYFDRRNCATPDELADETFNRVARRLEEQGEIVTDSPAHYCYIVARFVLLETLRKQQLEEPLDERIPRTSPPETSPCDEMQEREKRSNCLDRCMSALEVGDRELIVNYYQGGQRARINNRNSMAAQLGLTRNALSIRACRIRTKLDVCMRRCLNTVG